MKHIQKSTILLIAIVVTGILIFIIVSSMIQLDFVHRDFYEVNDENDDGRTFTVDHSDKGFGNEYAAWAALQLSPSYSFGVKFDNIRINQGATIKKAYIELYSTGSPGFRRPNCMIYCDDADSATNFSTVGVLDICGRNYTENYTQWNTTIEYGEWVKTPPLVKQLQEVVNRENFTSENSIAFLFVTEGFLEYSASFRNYNTGSPAKLYVEWIETN